MAACESGRRDLVLLIIHVDADRAAIEGQIAHMRSGSALCHCYSGVTTRIEWHIESDVRELGRLAYTPLKQCKVPVLFDAR